MLEGRINRTTYIVQIVGISLLASVVYFLVENVQNSFYSTVGVFIMLSLIMLHISVTTKRLHDLGYGNIFLVLVASLLTITFFILAIFPGKEEENQFGPKP